MKCAVITPIGPGHIHLYEECRRSIESAIKHSSGPFDEISIISIDDSSGDLGRSAARNKAIKKAGSDNIEWIFFLDSDDLLFPNAFELVHNYIHDYTAIWGVIVNVAPDSQEIILRNPQVFMMEKLDDLLMFDPFYTLQMGHFVRTKIADKNPFNESMNTGEDFDYYIRIWEQYRCIKIPEPLFINRRGLHSGGPKSATGSEWNSVVERIISEHRKKHGIHADRQTVLEKMKSNMRKYAGYLESKKSGK